MGVIAWTMATDLMSISFDLMSHIEFPMNVICSSLTPDNDTLIHRSTGYDESRQCKNCGSTRLFFTRSSTLTPSIFTWLMVDDLSAFEIALNVRAASSRWIIQLQIFSVLSSLNFWVICWKNVIRLLSSRINGGADVDVPRPDRAGADKSKSRRFENPSRYGRSCGPRSDVWSPKITWARR